MLTGRFSDGRTAASRPVTLHLGAGSWEIRDDDGALLRIWHHQDIAPAEALAVGGVRVTCGADPDAVLTLPSLPAGFAARRSPNSSRLKVIAAALAMVAAMAGLAAALPPAGRLAAGLIPRDLEQRLGDGVARNIDAGRACHASAGDAALAALTARLAASLPEDQRPHRVAVVDAHDVNALALPGGNIVIFKGLLAAAHDADEVAGVLAHEMTHVALRHPLAGMMREFEIVALVALITGDTSGVLAGGAALTLSNAYSRDDEAAADAGAVRLLAAAGIGSDGLAEFFRRIAKDDAMPLWLANHPQPLDRAAAIDASRAPARRPALTPDQWAALRDICR